MKTLILALILMPSAAIAAGPFIDGNKLLSYCVPEEHPSYTSFKSGLCGGYVAGVMDADGIFAARVGKKRAVYRCAPNEMTVGQLAKVVYQYLETNPELLHLSASSSVFRAIDEAFPCPD